MFILFAELTAIFFKWPILSDFQNTLPTIFIKEG